MLFSEGDLSKHNKNLNVDVQSYISVVLNKLLPCYVTGQRGRFPPAGEIFALQPLHVVGSQKSLIVTADQASIPPDMFSGLKRLT